jgi:uncharacterized OB-fold protein
MTTTTEDMIDAAFPAPEATDANVPYWRALDEGRLDFQRCGACGHAWLPPRGECPHCLARQVKWETASGRARLLSWVVYHHGYHPYFAARLPYNVAVVELAEGPRLISNIVEPAKNLRIDAALALVIQREAGFALPRFSLVNP